MPIEWYHKEHSLEERNDLYIELATNYSVEAIKKCLNENLLLKKAIDYSSIDAIICVSSTGMLRQALMHGS